MTPSIGIVIPCYNEEDILENSLQTLDALMKNLFGSGQISEYRFICIDDGSKDKTWSIIKEFAKKDSYSIKGLKLSHNSGHQNALLAGIEYASKYFDAIITLDADLQDDISVIPQMIEQFNNGSEIVYGVRSNRETDSFIKEKTANIFYSLMRKSRTDTIPNHADFRLMSKRAVNALLSFNERNIFLRGLVPLIGYNSSIVYYERKPRKNGQSKYPFAKMLNFAVEGITSFSIKPIRSIFIIGIIFLFFTLSISIYVVIAILLGRSYPGWASLMLSLWFIGSLLLIALGIIGEYIGKIYLEVKNRPRYFIEETTEEK